MTMIAGLEFPSQGIGEVLTGVVGPKPLTHHPHLETPLDGLTVADLPLFRFRELDDEHAETFVLDDPPIYVGTTARGLHGVLIGVRRGDDGPVGVSLLTWTDKSASLNYHFPTLQYLRPKDMRFSYGWVPTHGDPTNWSVRWFPLPAETAHVEFAVDGTVVESIRPTSRVALLQTVLADAEVRQVQGTAYDSAGQPLLVKRHNGTLGWS